MNKKPIAIFLFTLFVIASVGSLYTSSIAVLKMAGLPILDNLRWNVFINAYLEYGKDPLYKKYIIAGFAGLAAPLVTILLLLGFIIIGMQEKKGLHGNARLASDMDLSKSGFFPSKLDIKKQKHPPILIGKMIKGRFKGLFLQYFGQQFLMLFAPTRSGKGVGIVIPNCIHYPHSIVVLDIKLENFIFSAGYRRDTLGQDVFLFSPDGYATSDDLKHRRLRSHRYNPLFYIRRDAIYRVGDLEKISSILFPESGGENDMWTNLSSNLFNGLVLFLLDTENEPNVKVTLSAVLKLSVPSTGESLGAFMERVIEERNDEKNIKAWEEYRNNNGARPLKNVLSQETVIRFRQFIGQDPKQQGNIKLTFDAALKIFGNPVCAAATDGNDFDLRDVRRKKMSIYFGLSPDALPVYSKLTNLFFSQLVNENVGTGKLPEQDPAFKYQCLLILDEFTSMGRVDIIQKAIAFTAGYNIRYLFILQNKGQLADEKKGYGKEGADTFLENCAVELVYPPKSVNEQVKLVSETIGYKDVKVPNDSRTSGKSSSSTKSFSIQKRAVLLPQEIVELREHKYITPKGERTTFATKQIIMSEFCRSFIADKIVYFSEPFFIKAKKYSESNVPVVHQLEITEDEVAKALYEQEQRKLNYVEPEEE
ncbi:type IV secretory system conjugative DNA transfer family protein [Hafnia paralvei]|uniref:type IV secretory system conjugative DNA transfer family protein n=1 Tax=Hafnia paralvei TaxID=546367 RepID=UPI002FDC1E07